MLTAVQPSSAPSMVAQDMAVPATTLRRCYVVVTMPDGSRGEHTGLYANTIDAVIRAQELFPEAKVEVAVQARGRRSAA